MSGGEKRKGRVESGGGRELKRRRTTTTSGESSRSEDSEEKTPCLLSYHCDGYGPVLYGVDHFNGGKKSDSSPPPAPPLRRMTSLNSRLTPNGNMVVALGSTVYVLGGIADTNIAGEEEEEEEEVEVEVEVEAWKRAPDMLNARNRGKAIIVEGKIYVFGGTHLDKAQDPWGEVFDPVKTKWEPLPPPPVYLDDYELRAGPVVAYGPSSSSIMLGTTTKYVYNVKSGSWEQPAWPVYGGDGLKPIGVGNILYYTSRGKLIAANMKTHRHYRGQIKGSTLGMKKHGDGSCSCCHYDPDGEPQLVHLGGKEFCFFTLDTNRCCTRTKVCCTKFQVTKRIRPPPNKPNDMGSLKGSVVSKVAYIVDQPLQDTGHHCFLMDAMPGGKKEVEWEGPKKPKKSKKYLSKKKSAGEMELAI
ncbi:hypothetical protein Vadar_020092 [Vaccinium darrowii]|uniref:Uncharacterized protein n=1 Tax=Vaccinium darrowii TaxID=229202 RepID=A0ACB7Y1A8_9ERIC|nr:hypothetical protein Vadar_020092 [Vaccinium darrowii]